MHDIVVSLLPLDIEQRSLPCPALYWLHKTMSARGRLSKTSKDVKLPTASKSRSLQSVPAYILCCFVQKWALALLCILVSITGSTNLVIEANINVFWRNASSPQYGPLVGPYINLVRSNALNPIVLWYKKKIGKRFLMSYLSLIQLSIIKNFSVGKKHISLQRPL